MFNIYYMKSGIYKITSKSNNKFYIGSSKNTNERWKRHIRDLRNGRHINQHLQRCYDKYGESDLLFEVIEFCDENELLIKEQYYLDFLKAYEIGFNIGKCASGGDNLTNNPNRQVIIEKIRNTIKENIKNMSEKERKERWGKYGEENPNFGNKWSDEMKRKNSIRNKGIEPINKGKSNFELLGEERAKEISKKLSEYASNRKGEKNPFYNKKHTKETKEKIGKSNKGKKPKNRIKLSINGELFDSYQDASTTLDIPVVTIRWRCLSENPKFINYKLI